MYNFHDCQRRNYKGLTIESLILGLTVSFRIQERSYSHHPAAPMGRLRSQLVVLISTLQVQGLAPGPSCKN